MAEPRNLPSFGRFNAFGHLAESDDPSSERHS
jgi:hypothetical protein